MTTPEILAVGREKGPSDWRIRVFGNMYPALQGQAENDVALDGDPIFPKGPGQGEHEVIVYTPDHEGSLGTLDEDHLAALLKLLRDRHQALQASSPRVQHVMSFCNHGPRAGATLAHPHLQILASPLVPATILEKSLRMSSFREEHGDCLVCTNLQREVEVGERMVEESPQGICVAPWASRFPFEMRIIPCPHRPRFEDVPDDEMAGLAGLLKSAVARLSKIHENPSYNVILHSAGASTREFHWHLEILPRLTRWAGFEVGSGHAINSITPEDAAAQLRKVI